MPADRLAMRQIKDILRLRHDAGLSLREISRSLNLSVGAVSKYLQLAAAAGIGWPPPTELDEGSLARKLQPPPPNLSAAPLPDFTRLHQELRCKGVTLQLLWEEYAEADPAGHYSYPHFCALYREWRRRLSPTMRQTHAPGDKLFVDYCGPTIPVIDPLTGEVRDAQIFVAVLGASNYTYAEATFTQQLRDWIGSHVRAFAFFGGVPRLVVPDNLKSGVTRACRFEPALSRTYAEVLEHYDTAALPARPYKPRDKAKVEVGVQIVERWVLARLRKLTFFSLTDLNAAVRQLLDVLNHKPFRKLPGSRHSQFEAQEKAALKPLPLRAYEYAEWKKARVHIDYHVEVDGHYYSVPHSLIRRQLDVRLTATAIECFLNNQRVAVHPRSDRRGGHSTVTEHMPKAHRAHLEWTPGRFLNWAIAVGPHTRDLVRHLLTNRPHPEMGFRSCLGLLSLEKRFGKERLEAACHRALALSSPTRLSVLSILEKGLDSQPLPGSDAEAAATPVVHQNVRGAAYYQ
ncbi:MAG TPA: IS21 family transposase [Blastocatellia bacterium]|nr:IS21 family transposase [Blastocatellia bacterium]